MWIDGDHAALARYHAGQSTGEDTATFWTRLRIIRKDRTTAKIRAKQQKEQEAHDPF
jgi:hypothetical protein